MDFILDAIKSFSGMLRPHIEFMALAISVSLLILYGGGFNTLVKSKLAGMNRLLRWLIFTAICIFVYGLILQVSSKILTLLLEEFSDKFLSPVVLILFLTLGFFAEKHNR